MFYLRSLVAKMLLISLFAGAFFVTPLDIPAQAATNEPAPTAAEVLVIYNTSYVTDEDVNLTQDSEQIAEYYQTQRPGVTVQGFAMPLTEEITWAQYNSTIADPLENYLTTNNLEDEIKIIVTVKGVPLKIMGDPGLHDPWDDPLCEPFCPVNYASVDAGISLSYQDFKSTSRHTNAYYNTDTTFAENNHFKSNYFTNGQFTLSYLVSRLDAYTLSDVLAMIDRGVAADTTSTGYWVLDSSATMNHAAYSTARTRLLSFHKNVLYDPYPGSTYITTSVNPIMGYSSFGYLDGLGDGYVSNDPANPNHFDFDLLNGAVMSTWESYNAWGFQDADQHYHGQIGEWIAIGGSGGIGNVYEPYSTSLAREEIWMTAYAVGYPWIEAAYMSMPKMGYAQTVLGDPLMVIADNVHPASVSSFTATGVDTAINLVWNNPADPDFAGVTVVRKTGSYPTSVTDGTAVYTGTGTSYSNSGLGNGTTYYYAAFAFDTTYNYSSLANDSKASAYAADATPPGEVTDLQALVSVGMANLHWTNPVDSDFLRVVLVRKLGSYPISVVDGTTVYSGTSTSYLNVGLTGGVTYYYSAFAQDTSLNYSSLGTESRTSVFFAASSSGGGSGGSGGGGGGSGSGNGNVNPPVVVTPPVQIVAPVSVDPILAVVKDIVAIIREEKFVMMMLTDPVSHFISQGTHSTVKLGSGERAAALSSYKEVFGKNPVTASEWEDVLNIANGRWPLGVNKPAEARGYLNFRAAYGRNADMKNSTDVNALKMIIYGVRSTKPRDLKAEAAAIAKFKAIYGFNPQTARQWNIVRAVAYSGVKR